MLHAQHIHISQRIFIPSYFLWYPNLSSDANDTASRPWSSVTRLLTLLVTSLAEIIGAAVDDDSATEHALGSDQLDELVRDAALAVALAVGLKVAQVADVALGVLGGTVGLGVRVDCVERLKVRFVLSLLLRLCMAMNGCHLQ